MSILRYGNASLFRRGAASDEGKLAYLQTVWAAVNKLVFDGRLKQPAIKLSAKKTAGEIGYSGYVLGSWVPSTRTILFSPRLFTVTEALALDTIVHECCHQAVTDIDGDAGLDHGPKWRAWMKRAGLKPIAVQDAGHIQQFLRPGERAVIQNRQRLLDAATEYPMKKLKVGSYLRFLDPTNRWISCMVAGFTKRGTERAAVFNLTSSHWVAVPLSNLWLPTKPRRGAKPLWTRKLRRYSDHLGATLTDWRNTPQY